MTPTLPLGIPLNHPINQPWQKQPQDRVRALKERISEYLDSKEILNEQTRMELIKIIIEEREQFWE